jgi:peptide deformylase
MAIRKVVTPPNPTLRKTASRVPTIDKDVARLIEDMIETMRAASGVGLAAPQVDVGLRVITVEYGEGLEDPDAPTQETTLYVVVNPELTYISPETVLGNEACLSLPGYFGEVERSTAVTVTGLNRHGMPFRLETEGWLARIFQHEIDHLNGVLYIDRATQVWRVDQAGEQEQPTAV